MKMKTVPPVQSRRERAKADKRRRILEASRKLFTSQGFEQTTVQQVADQADIAVGTLFLYVRDKSELLLLLFTERLEELVVANAPLLKSGHGLQRSVLAFFDEVLTFYEEEPELSRLFWREFLSSKQESRAALNTVTDSIIKALRERLVLAQEKSEIGDHVDPSVAALHIYALFHATISFHLVQCGPFISSDETLSVLLNSFCEGLRPSTQGQPKSHSKKERSGTAQRRRSEAGQQSS